jgi:hypothetical protein
MSTKKIKLDGVYQAEANRIVEARREGQIIHGSGDIRAAGNQVEIMVRNVISDRLPPRYRTTHGHIIDYNGRTSPQLDVMIAENLASKSLFEAADGTEYVPYESVCAYAEIKSSYYQSQEPIKAFSESIVRIQESLARQTHIEHRILNFMVLASANYFQSSNVEEFYKSTPRKLLPNFVCLLDEGTIVYTKFLQNGHGQPVPVSYYLAEAIEAPTDDKHHWSLIRWGKENERAGVNLMFLHLSLVQHLQNCGLATPNLFPYLVLSLRWDGGEMFA